MTRADVIRMAREAGLCSWAVVPEAEAKKLERLVALAQAAEREACAKLLDQTWFKTQDDCAAAIRARSKT